MMDGVLFYSSRKVYEILQPNRTKFLGMLLFLICGNENMYIFLQASYLNAYVNVKREFKKMIRQGVVLQNEIDVQKFQCSPLVLSLVTNMIMHRYKSVLCLGLSVWQTKISWGNSGASVEKQSGTRGVTLQLEKAAVQQVTIHCQVQLVTLLTHIHFLNSRVLYYHVLDTEREE